jgi:glycosyltransferase involved in cell wall biosynthesis
VTSPTVSWVMPARDAAETIRDSIDSIIRQTYEDWELIVVDDGSTDQTGAIVDRYAEEDPRIRVIRTTGVGEPAARNIAVGAARGRWIAMLDADDIAVPERLQRQVPFMERHPELFASASRGILFVRPGQALGLTSVDTPKNTEELAALKRDVHLFVLCHPTLIFRADRLRSVGAYDESFFQACDAELFNRAIYSHDLQILLIDEPLTWYRIAAGGMSTQGLALQRRVLRYLEERNHQWLASEQPPTLEEYLATTPDLRTRARWKRHDIGARLYRKAGIQFGEGRPVRAIANVALAMALHPRYALRKARRQKTKRSELERLDESHARADKPRD